MAFQTSPPKKISSSTATSHRARESSETTVDMSLCALVCSAVLTVDTDCSLTVATVCGWSFFFFFCDCVKSTMTTAKTTFKRAVCSKTWLEILLKAVNSPGPSSLGIPLCTAKRKKPSCPLRVSWRVLKQCVHFSIIFNSQNVKTGNTFTPNFLTRNTNATAHFLNSSFSLFTKISLLACLH